MKRKYAAVANFVVILQYYMFKKKVFLFPDRAFSQKICLFIFKYAYGGLIEINVTFFFFGEVIMNTHTIYYH